MGKELIMTQAASPSWLARTVGSVTADSIAAKIVSASSITALLTAAAYEWRIGWAQGIAGRRGVSVEYIQLSSDPAATPVQIVALLLFVSLLALLAAMLLPAFTAWPVPAGLGIWFLIRVPWDVLRHPHTQFVWYDLVIAAAFFLLAVAVYLVGRIVRRLARAWRDPRPSRTPPAWLRFIVQRLDLRQPAWWDKATTLLPIVILISGLVFAAFMGASWFGSWLGKQSAQPDQAAVQGGHVYGVLGETSGGLMVVRSVDFCGASAPERASSVRVTGARSLLLDPEGTQVIRLRRSLRLVDQCPSGH
jgi:hypothetical protein